MGRRYCMAHRRPKVCYETEEIAQIALEDVSGPGHHRKPGNAGKVPTRVYACGDHFHLTSWESPTKPRR